MPNHVTNIVTPASDEYDVIEIMGITGLFANEKIPLNEVPKELNKYDLRHSDDGQRFASIEKCVSVNYGGTFMTNKAIDLGEDGYISFTDETEPEFLGIQAKLSDLINDRIEILEKGELMDLC